MAEGGGAFHEVAGLVDEDGVGGGPAGGFHTPVGLGPEQGGAFLVGEQVRGVGVEEVGVTEQAQDQLGRVDGRPHLLDQGFHGAVAGHGVLDAVVWGLPGLFHPDQHGVRDALGQGLAGGAVADVAGEEFLDQGGDLVGGDAPAAGAADHDEGFGGAPDVGAQRAAQHLGHAGVALDDRGRGRVGPGDRDVGDEESTVAWCTVSSPRAGRTCSM